MPVIALGLTLLTVFWVPVIFCVPVIPSASASASMSTSASTSASASISTSVSTSASAGAGASTATASGRGTTADRYVLPIADAPPSGTSRATLRESGLLVNDFAPPSVRWGAGHRGVDLATDAGAAVIAPSAGVVTFSGFVVDRPLVVITHADGLRSTLEPVAESPPVGTSVTSGTAVGVVPDAAQSHCAPVACVHWGVRRGTEYIDPLALVGAVEPIVLLPLE
jgi:murein DD-endopeptidase MepM/ murein hydrolase activator NlpD